MKTFLIVFISVLLAGGILVGWQSRDKEQQNKHERSVLLSLSLAESEVRLYNARSGSSEYEKEQKELIARMKEQIPELRTLAKSTRTSAADAKRLEDFASQFDYADR